MKLTLGRKPLVAVFVANFTTIVEKKTKIARINLFLAALFIIFTAHLIPPSNYGEFQ